MNDEEVNEAPQALSEVRLSPDVRQSPRKAITEEGGTRATFAAWTGLTMAVMPKWQKRRRRRLTVMAELTAMAAAAAAVRILLPRTLR